MIITSKEQRKSIFRYWYSGINNKTITSYKAFRKTVQGTIGCDGAVVVRWCGMWVCIERDGYGHT